jgi:hypothetical protein
MGACSSRLFKKNWAFACWAETSRQSEQTLDLFDVKFLYVYLGFSRYFSELGMKTELILINLVYHIYAPKFVSVKFGFGFSVRFWVFMPTPSLRYFDMMVNICYGV